MTPTPIPVDADGSRPDAWGYLVDVREQGLERGADEYRWLGAA